MLAVGDASLVAVEEALTAILRQANLRRLHDLVAARAGVTLDRAAYPLLARLASGGPLRLSHLANLLGVAVPTVSRQVAQLERTGMVRRTPDPADARVAMLELTDEGRGALRQIREAWRGALAEVLESWPEEDRTQLALLLGRLTIDLLALR